MFSNVLCKSLNFLELPEISTCKQMVKCPFAHTFAQPGLILNNYNYKMNNLGACNTLPLKERKFDCKENFLNLCTLLPTYGTQTLNTTAQHIYTAAFLFKGFTCLITNQLWTRHQPSHCLCLWYVWCPDCILARSNSTSPIVDFCSSSCGWRWGDCDLWKQAQGEP